MITRQELLLLNFKVTGTSLGFSSYFPSFSNSTTSFCSKIMVFFGFNFCNSLYTRFRSKHLALEIGVHSFEALKLWFVKRLKQFNTCCYPDHMQTLEHKDGLNSMRHSNVHRNCECLVRCVNWCQRSLDAWMHMQCFLT